MVERDTIRVLCLSDGTTESALDRSTTPFEIRSVDTLDEALRALRDHTVDVDCVVVDGRTIDESDVVTRFNAASPSLPVVLVVASDDAETRALEEGASDVIRLAAGDDVRDRAAVLSHRVRSAVERVRVYRRAAETERLSRLVREVTQAVVEATTQADVERAVCTHLADGDMYPYVWCGRLEEGKAISIETDAGSAGFPGVVPVGTDGELSERSPITRAVETRNVVVIQDVREDPTFEPWRDAATERGLRSLAAVPLVDDEVYGVLCLYADRPWAFETTEQVLLSDLGGAIGHATRAARLRSKYRRFREAVEHAGHSIYITDTDGTIQYVNPAFERTTGYSAEEAIGNDPSLLKSGEYGPEFYSRLWGTILDGDVWNDNIVNQRKNGERYHIEQTIAPIRDENGDIDGFVAVNNDITVLKEKEEALERQNERLETFADIVSHDLRNPLNVATGRLELAQETGDLSHLDESAAALDRIDQLLGDLLTLARTGRHIGDVESIPLDELAREAWSTVVTADATLQIETTAHVRADRSRLRQALENLFRNAVEHGSTGNRTEQPSDDAVEHGSTGNQNERRSGDAAEHGGEGVTVRVGTFDGGFFVEDDGPGVPPASRDAVFDTGHTTARAGSGLGLAIVARVANGHGWDVSLTASDSGGARFEFTGVDVSESATRSSRNRTGTQ